jgi:NAD-dependent deacetylase
VIEYHGNSRLLRCLACRVRHPAVPTLLERLPPACPVCGGLLKPDFVFFGEGIPAEAAYAAEYAAENADAMILIGTTGEVYPAAMLPERAKANGAAVIEINPNRSNYTGPITDIFLKTGAVEGIRLINEELRRRGIV